ncbi:MAG TPA: protein-disulfide reductase DsbD domain-containing protein, partial [Steroidobacteraceae bacterium]|nr:protein-disulfide reductase DsbD domain-containing protein [Steroidobacteraceae bacterium]
KLLALLSAKIATGWHLYAMNQEPGGPRSLRIAVPATQDYELQTVNAPPASEAHDSNFDAPTRYYEESVVFELPIVRRSSVSKNLVTEVRYQACNYQMCLPPTMVKVETAVP